MQVTEFGSVKEYAFGFGLALFLGTVLTYVTRNIARVRGWVVAASSERHIHKQPIPRIGGVAIAFTFLAVYEFSVLRGVARWSTILPVLIPSLVMFAVGLADDFMNLQAKLKLAFQLLAGGLFCWFGLRFWEGTLVVSGIDFGPALSILSTIAWVVVITNALNLIDGLDGLAAGSALFSVVTLFMLALFRAHGSVAFSTVIMAGALLGFLRYNFNPASIFLGDSGSLFIGCMLSGLTLKANNAAMPELVSVAIPVVSFGLPVVETTVSILRRFLSGKPVFGADSDHIHHKLLRKGLSHRQVVIVLYGFSAVCALLSLFLLYPDRGVVAVTLLVAGTVFFIGVQQVGYLEFAEVSRMAQRTMLQKAIISNNLTVRRASMQLEKCRTEHEIRLAIELVFGEEFARCELYLFEQGWDDLADALDPALWSFNVKLKHSTGAPMGELRLSSFRSGPVKMDLNVVLEEFAPALVQALERVHRETLTPVYFVQTLDRRNIEKTASGMKVVEQ